MITAIIQARMGSSRLPGKVMMNLGGVPMLQFQINRIKKCSLVDEIVVATSDSKSDDVIAQYCELNSIKFFRGSENDVLGRYYNAAIKFKSEIIVRLTADCPLVDPELIDKTIELFLSDKKCDYAGNTVPPETSRFPDGSDVEVFSFSALERAHKEATNQQEREHVTFYFWKSVKKSEFNVKQLYIESNFSGYRYTVDYPEDFLVVTKIVEILNKQNKFGSLHQIIEIIESYSELKALNSKYYFGIGWDANAKK